MNNFLKISLFVCALLSTVSLSLRAATSPQEKAFTDKYKAAFEAKDTAALESFLYTHSKIDLVDLTSEDVKKAAAPQDSPTGGKVCLVLKPTKKLIITIEKKDANGSSSSSTENFIAEKDGKFVVPVPGPCK